MMTNNQQPTPLRQRLRKVKANNKARPTERHQSFGRGFTLIEMIVALTLFIIVMTISMGSIINIFDANRKSRSLKTVLNNLNLSVESMAKEMRFGKNYHCGVGDLTLPQNCPSGDNYITFLSSDNVLVSYLLHGSSIEKRLGTGDFIPITAPEIVIDDLTFYTLGAGTSDTLQAKVIMKIKSHSGSGKGRSDFVLETLVSQRILDI